MPRPLGRVNNPNAFFGVITRAQATGPSHIMQVLFCYYYYYYYYYYSLLPRDLTVILFVSPMWPGYSEPFVSRSAVIFSNLGLWISCLVNMAAITIDKNAQQKSWKSWQLSKIAPRNWWQVQSCVVLIGFRIKGVNFMVKMTFFYAYWNLLLADEDNVMKFNSLKYQLQNSGENHGNDEI